MASIQTTETKTIKLNQSRGETKEVFLALESKIFSITQEEGARWEGVGKIIGVYSSFQKLNSIHLYTN